MRRLNTASAPVASAPLRETLLYGALIVLFSVSVQAQEAPDETEDDGEDPVELESLQVTGSRILRDSNLESSAPVATVTAEQLQRSGEYSVAEVLREVPSLLTSVSSETSIDSVFANSTGQSVLQLRGLGAERTLVLVDGRRHVSGVAGSQAVEVGSIPPALIERVEVLTGGASAVYGADAVSGVVNFVLKDDFEGLELRAQGGLATEDWDGETYSFSGTYGVNFNDYRGNITLSGSYQKTNEIRFGDRDFSRNNGIADDLPNPDLFAGTAAPGAPTRVIRSQPTFSISSHLGLIAPGDFSAMGNDLNGNGIADCQESFVGQNVEGIIGGCWVIDDGQVRPFEDGEITRLTNQFGGDGVPNNFDEDFLIPENERYDFTGRFNYEFTPGLRLFGEGKYVRQDTQFGGPLNTFYDLLTISSDNPFIPAELQDVADNSEVPGFLVPPSGITTGLFMNRDPADLGPNINENQRETYRFVGGLEGDFDNGLAYEISGNYGKFERTLLDRNSVVMDRWFAAIDATTDASGNPVCRSSLDGTIPATTPFDIPLFDFGYFTFNPNDGSCVPVNPFGRGAPSQEAIDFVTTTAVSTFELEQVVFTGFLTGDTRALFELPGGAVQWVVGAEYREEESTSTFDSLEQGICPVDTPDCEAGQFVGDITDADGERVYRQNSLVFDPAARIQNSGGEFDVWDVFGEVSLPIIAGVNFAEELRVDGSVRYSNYSTIGTSTTWNLGALWAPVQDVTLRGTYAEAVRAPNINELFDPEQGAFFRPEDPCDQSAIDSLFEAGDPNAANREANCRADGIPEGFVDPLTARFVGVTSGNPDLEEETATTFTIGAILEPRFLPNLTLSIDYFDIEIENAIASVSDQDIVDNCYDSAAFPTSQFCELFSRNRDPDSPLFLGFDFLRQTEINFASLETSGFDLSGSYYFDMGANRFTLQGNATYIEKLDEFFDPGDPDAVDPELGELQRPQWAANVTLGWERGPFQVSWNTVYLGEMGLRAVEIETQPEVFGPDGLADATLIHDLSASWMFRDSLLLFGGVNNVFDEEPFITEQAYPVNPRGRFLFAGAEFYY